MINNHIKELVHRFWPHLTSIAIIAAAYGLYVYFAYYDTRTDDAYVSAHVVNIASIVSGPILAIHVKDNQSVKQGQKLLVIDPKPYLYDMQKAKAEWNLALKKYENDKYQIKVAEQQLKKAKDLLSLSEEYVKRYQPLQKKGDLATIKLLDAQAKLHEHTGAVIAATQQLKIAQENLNTNDILAAKANFDKAQYLYRHTTLYAPEDGYITNFNLRHGQYIKRGQGLFALVETKHWWVVSRYRETAIRLIQVGDRAKIMLDMYPGKIFHGHVESIGWGINRVQSGPVAPSTLTYLEATEDWIQIAQRFPVRIYFDKLDERYPLRIGATATTITYR